MLTIAFLVNNMYNIGMENKEKKIFFSSTEVAKLLNISRISVFNKIKKGIIKAEKVGRNYIISQKEVECLLKDNEDLTKKDRLEIGNAVERAIKEYGQAIRMLGKE